MKAIIRIVFFLTIGIFVWFIVKVVQELKNRKVKEESNENNNNQSS